MFADADQGRSAGADDTPISFKKGQKMNLRKRLSAMTVTVILGGGLAVAVNTPALAVNNFLMNYIGGINPHEGSVPLACNHGQNDSYVLTGVISYTNNCDVRVWVYAPGGGNQCVNPNSGAQAQFSDVSREYISDNSSKC
jgi:hypothetical protein